MRWFPVILYAAIIFWSSSTYAPLPKIPMSHGDKILHFIEFGLLCFLICRAMEPSGRDLRRIMWLAILASSAYGALDEVHQYFTPFRHAEAGDWWAGTFGAIAAGVLWKRAAEGHDLQKSDTDKDKDIS